MRSYRLVAAALAALALSCGAPRRDPGGLVVVSQGWPITLEPHRLPEMFTMLVQANIYEGLVEFDPSMKVLPSLAENWETEDAVTWLFRLRPGVRFHDGSGLSADDVVYSLLRAKSDTGSALWSSFVQVRAIEKVDGRTVRIVAARPFPLLLYKLAGVYIVPQRAHRAAGAGGFDRSPVGTGPFRLESYPQGGPLVLARFDGYWGRRPAVTRITYLVENDTARIARMLEAPGASVVVPMLDQAAARTLEQRAGKHYRVLRRPGLVLRYLGIRAGTKPLADPRVRRALSLAIDRAALADVICSGYASPANQLVPTTVFGYNQALPQLRYDPDESRRLLAGVPLRDPGLSLTVLDARAPAGRLLQQQLERVGFTVSVNALPRESFFRALDTARTVLLGYASASGDASDLLDEVVHSRRDGYGPRNYGNYANPRVDRLIEFSDTCFSQERRLEAIQQAIALATADLAIVPLYCEDQVCGVSSTVQWTPRLDMMVLGKDVTPK